MRAPVQHIVNQQIFWISPERVLFWENENTLIASDLHIGKTGHFRKSGIALPQSLFKEDLQRLIAQIQHFAPRQLLVVGDLFHSVANKELDLFRKWRDDLPNLSIILVKGNHDILKDDWYVNAGISLIKKSLFINGFCFTHDNDQCGDTGDQTAPHETSYTISGHIHPGVRVRGHGRQSLSLPCFYFGAAFAILPAFSHFSGTALIIPKVGDCVFALVDNTIMKLC
jgi:DNA ligase-associated metallophosphoesterase